MKSLHKKLIITTIILVALIAVLCACKTNKCKDGHTWELTSITATCYDSGVETYKCKKCKTTKTENVEAYGHDLVQSSYTAPTCKTNGEEVKKCSRCGFESKQTLLVVGHDYQVKSTTPSTCTTHGSQLSECSMCHETKMEQLPLLNHNYQLIASTPSTCTVNGTNTYKCKDCNNIYTEDIKLLDHDFELVDTIESTCIEHGLKNYKCKNCTAMYSEELPYGNHKYETQTIESTCFTHGGEKEICSVCKDAKSASETPLLVHNFDEDGYCTHCGIYETLFDENALNVSWGGTPVGTIRGSLPANFNDTNKSVPDSYWKEHTVTLTITMYDSEGIELESHSFTSTTIPHEGTNNGKLTIQYVSMEGLIGNAYPNGFIVFLTEGNKYSPESRQNCASFRIELSSEGYKSIEKTYNIS